MSLFAAASARATSASAGAGAGAGFGVLACVAVAVPTRFAAGNVLFLELELECAELVCGPLSGDAAGGFAGGLGGPRSGDLNGLWSASFRRRRLGAGGRSIFWASGSASVELHVGEC